MQWPSIGAQYRYFVLEQEKTNAQAKLKEVIEDVRKQRDAGELFGNPITDYFENPLNSLPPPEAWPAVTSETL